MLLTTPERAETICPFVISTCITPRTSPVDAGGNYSYRNGKIICSDGKLLMRLSHTGMALWSDTEPGQLLYVEGNILYRHSMRHRHRTKVFESQNLKELDRRVSSILHDRYLTVPMYGTVHHIDCLDGSLFDTSIAPRDFVGLSADGRTPISSSLPSFECAVTLNANGDDVVVASVPVYDKIIVTEALSEDSEPLQIPVSKKYRNTIINFFSITRDLGLVNYRTDTEVGIMRLTENGWAAREALFRAPDGMRINAATTDYQGNTFFIGLIERTGEKKQSIEIFPTRVPA